MGLKFGLTLKNECGFKVSENKMINSVIVQNIIFLPIGIPRGGVANAPQYCFC